jgi:hypothetical protein
MRLRSAPNPDPRVHYAIRFVAGSLVLLSLALAVWVSPWWLLFTAFVGANLLQSAITRWCLMETILAKVGIVGRRGSA